MQKFAHHQHKGWVWFGWSLSLFNNQQLVVDIIYSNSLVNRCINKWEDSPLNSQFNKKAMANTFGKNEPEKFKNNTNHYHHHSNNNLSFDNQIKIKAQSVLPIPSMFGEIKSVQGMNENYLATFKMK